MTEQKEKKYSGYGYHGGGRKREGEEARRETVAFVCTPSQKEKLKEKAKEAGLSVSKYITNILDL